MQKKPKPVTLIQKGSIPKQVEKEAEGLIWKTAIMTVMVSITVTFNQPSNGDYQHHARATKGLLEPQITSTSQHILKR